MIEPKFPKEKILTFKRFAGRRDLLSVLLEDGKECRIPAEGAGGLRLRCSPAG